MLVAAIKIFVIRLNAVAEQTTQDATIKIQPTVHPLHASLF